jgi:predicted nucleotide-binding protein (sugar kinase/HSP70/actin superfamily)
VTSIGLPRALLYYHYAPLLHAFLEALDVEVVVSPPTNRATLARGAERVIVETCLPVKVYCGHVLALVGQVDHILVPAIHSLHAAGLAAGTRNCPKLVGLPDLVSDVIPEAPLLVVDIDAQDRWQTFARSVLTLGRYLTRNPLLVKRAVERAQAAHECYHKLLLQGVDQPEAAALSPSPRPSPSPPNTALTVAVVGHPYNLYDEYVAQRLLARLRAMGVHVCTPFTLPFEDRWQNVRRLGQTPYWTYEDEVLGAAGSYVRRRVDGLLSVAAFGCAPDSVMLGRVAQAAQEAGVPHMSLILDEHTGEAGLVTRLEAFVDMLARVKRHKSPAPAPRCSL